MMSRELICGVVSANRNVLVAMTRTTATSPLLPFWNQAGAEARLVEVLWADMAGRSTKAPAPDSPGLAVPLIVWLVKPR